MAENIIMPKLGERIRITPRARRIAAEQGINLEGAGLSQEPVIREGSAKKTSWIIWLPIK